ncbi:MAG: ABC transporter permease [Alistipes sp.]|nr:ABC transporter permease [Alistipes sp.]
MKNIGLIVMREFKERVYKKSFIITTILMPLMMVLLSVAPTLIMMFAKGEERNITVIDHSGVIASQLTSDEEVAFTLSEDGDLQEALKRSLADENFGVLYIGRSIIENPSDIQLYTNASSSAIVEEKIADMVEGAIERERLKAYNLENLQEILDEVKADVNLSIYRNDDDALASSSSLFAGIVGMILGFVLYFFLVIYGSIVMSSIIEEKNSRILEVLVSTVRPFEMMMGKILGVALVAATQILVWGVLLIVMSGVVLPAVMPAELVANIEAVQGGADLTAMAASGIDTEMVTDLASLLDTAYITRIVVLLLLFMVGGFLLYAAMYAAVGASVDEAQDAQQLTTPITVPIILAFIVTTLVMNDPNSSVVFWFSMIPFTSPIVMMARIPSGIPAWEIVTSLVLLYATFVVMVWLAGKVYRVGIFMHGKKPTLKELYRWMKY